MRVRIIKTLRDEFQRLHNPLYSNSMFWVLGRLVSVSAGFVFWAVAARFYSIVDVGIAASLISLLGLVILFSRLGFDSSMIRFMPTHDKKSVFSTILIVTTLATVIASILGILLIAMFSPSLSLTHNLHYALAFIVFSVTNSVVAISGIAFVAIRRGSHYFGQNVLLASRIPLLVPLVFLGSYGIFSSVGFAYLLASVPALLIIGPSTGIALKIDWKFLRESFSFSFGNYISSVLANTPVLVMPMMILALLGEAEAGKYYIAFAVGHLVLIVPDAFSTSLFVEGSHGENLRKSARTSLTTVFSFLAVATLLIFIWGDSLLRLIGTEYSDASQLLLMIALSGFFYTACSVFVSIQNVRMRVRSVVKVNMFRFASLLGLSYFFLLRYGILGVGYAWLATYGIMTLILAIHARRVGWI